jgi:hypothetical protein
VIEPGRRRLRIAYVAVQPALVWDDGDQLVPGPEVQTVRLPLMHARQMLNELPDKVADLAEQIRDRDAAEAQLDDEDS